MVSRQALCAVLYSLYVPELKEILSSIRRPNTNLNKEGLVNSVADIIREHNCDYKFFQRHVLDNIKEDENALYAMADSILNLNEQQFENFLDMLPSWFVDYFDYNNEEEDKNYEGDEENYKDQEIHEIECPEIQIRWIGPFNYPNNQNAALRRKFGMYLLMSNTNLQYIGITFRSFEKRFADPNHPIHGINLLRVWTGKIIGSRSKKVLRQAERLLIFKHKKIKPALLNTQGIQIPTFGPLVIHSERYEYNGNYREERNHKLVRKITYKWDGKNCIGGEI